MLLAEREAAGGREVRQAKLKRIRASATFHPRGECKPCDGSAPDGNVFDIPANRARHCVDDACTETGTLCRALDAAHAVILHRKLRFIVPELAEPHAHLAGGFRVSVFERIGDPLCDDHSKVYAGIRLKLERLDVVLQLSDMALPAH